MHQWLTQEEIDEILDNLSDDTKGEDSTEEGVDVDEDIIKPLGAGVGGTPIVTIPEEQSVGSSSQPETRLKLRMRTHLNTLRPSHLSLEKIVDRIRTTWQRRSHPCLLGVGLTFL